MPAVASDSAFLEEGGFGRLPLQGGGQDSRRFSLEIAVTNLRMYDRSGLTSIERGGEFPVGF